MATGRHRRYQPGRRVQLRLQVAGALLLAVSGGVHLDLYLTGYWSIPVIGWLLLVQVVVACVLMVAVLVTHSWLAAAASAGFALSTLGPTCWPCGPGSSGSGRSAPGPGSRPG